MPGRRSSFGASRGAILLAGGGIVFAALAAYHNSFSAPFIFDDRSAIVQNPTVQHLWPLSDVLSPPRGSGLTVNGRPLLNLSLALNYAAGGLEVWGYHAVNLSIHILAGLGLFGVVRRSLQQPRLAGRFGDASLLLALCVALLWTLHPLQTEAVTYVVQRAESLMGLCYLLTLYTFIRGTASRQPWGWFTLCVAFCALGMTAKEVMVSAPFMILLYDRTFVAGSLGRAWRERWRLYAGLGCTWLLLGGLALATGSRGGTAGFGMGVSWHEYAWTQFSVILHYLRLALWPFPLVLDYGGSVLEHGIVQVMPSALIVLTMLSLTVIGLRHRPVLGFLGCWFFLILAPTSSIVPLADTMFEHRMYLSLAAVVALIAAGVYTWTGKSGVWLLFALSLASGILTARRNEDYRSELTVWADTVAKRPGNARARTNLGIALAESGRLPEAVAQYEAALRIEPAIPVAQLNLCDALTRLGRSAEALPHGEAAVKLDPQNANARVNLGLALVALGRAAEAVPHYEAALRLQPQAADVQADLGAAWLQLGRGAEAIGHYETALRLDPARAQTWCDLALALAQQGDSTAARRAVERALRVQPDLPEALWVLGNLDAVDGNFGPAIAHFRQAIAAAPEYVAARDSLANALLMTGQTDEAIVQYRQVLRQQPDDRGVQENLARALELSRSSRGAR